MRRQGLGRPGPLEYVSLDGLRIDGRRPSEIRKINCRIGVLGDGADGSAYLEQGNTKVIVAVYGPSDGHGDNKNEEMTVGCEYSVGSFAGGVRRRQRKGDRASLEAAVAIRKTFESVLLLKQFPRSRLDIVIQVLQADGGQRCAAINATSMALLNAGVPMRDLICASTVGHLDGQRLVDLNSVELAPDAPQLEVAVLAQAGSLSLVELSSRVPQVEQFEGMLESASDACRQVYEAISKEVNAHTIGLVHSRGMSVF